MIDVRVRDSLPTRDAQELGSSLSEPITHGQVRISPNSVEVPVVKEPLEPTVDAIATLVFEEPKDLWSGDESVLQDSPDESDVSILKHDRRTM
jgi:hypothetical protein